MKASSTCFQHASDLMKIMRKTNNFYFSGLYEGRCKPFIVAGHQVGLIRRDVLNNLKKYPEVFRISNEYVELNPEYKDFNERSDKIAEVLARMRKETDLISLKGWRNEFYEVRVPLINDTLMKMERSAICLFGIRNYNIIITGYTCHPEKGLCIWLQQRSSTKQTWPGYWDCFVGGGQPMGIGVLENAIKEAKEEASVDDEIIKKMVPAGCVSFFFESERGIYPCIHYVFDLELPLDFVPKNVDGEVKGFKLLPVDEVFHQYLCSETTRTTGAPVIIDFLVRKGYITTENEPEYAYLLELLHLPIQSIYTWPHTNVRHLS